MAGPQHRTAEYKRAQAALMRSVTPDSRCWRCRKLLSEHPPHKTGRPASWHAGHLPDGRTLALEASTCNVGDGARRGWQAAYGSRRREPISPNA